MPRRRFPSLVSAVVLGLAGAGAAPGQSVGSPYLTDSPATRPVAADPALPAMPPAPGGGLPPMAAPAVGPSPTFDRATGPMDIEYGKPRPVIDGIGWVVGIPKKLLLWDSRAENHSVSEETVGEVAAYLDARQLGDVKVRVNQYDPVGEWKRLVANDRISPGWKYTVGTLTNLKYTLLPGRIFGGDAYNPYTNSLSIYSDLPGLGLAESAYAYDVHQRTYPGLYASVQYLPLVSLWHETLATGEVIDYVVLTGTPEEQKEIRRTLYARYGLQIGGEATWVLPGGGLAFPILGAVGGHAYAAVENYQPATVPGDAAQPGPPMVTSTATALPTPTPASAHPSSSLSDRPTTYVGATPAARGAPAATTPPAPVVSDWPR